jgi:hypothetical protein
MPAGHLPCWRMSIPRYVSSARSTCSSSPGTGSVYTSTVASIPRSIWLDYDPNSSRIRPKLHYIVRFSPPQRKPHSRPGTHGLTSSAFYIFPRCLTHGDSSVCMQSFSALVRLALVWLPSNSQSSSLVLWGALSSLESDGIFGARRC